ncbi:trigger factor family protein, partial [Staphylococcus epidermidis]|uniref:trigger factor family protein n=1 Tax=Staphylococcus epidermidis TaxID=1282 RepID=UPI0011A6BECB
LPPHKLNKPVHQAFKKLVKQINVPPFPKPKLPRPIFQQPFPLEPLYQHALHILLPQPYPQPIQQTQINPLPQPQLNLTQIQKPKHFIFQPTLTVEPQVKLADYKPLQ